MNYVDRFLRHHLSEGALIAYVRDPLTGEHLQLDAREWESDSAPNEGFQNNFVDPEDSEQPGPSGTIIRPAIFSIIPAHPFFS